MDNQWTTRMIEGSTCDDLSFSASRLVTPEGHALPSHRQRVGENRRARRCILAIDAVAKMRRERAAYAPIHSRALPWDDHRLLGVHKARSSAQGPRQLSASSTGSHRRWDRFVELMARSNVLQSGFRSPRRRRVPSDRCTITQLCATRERRRGVARFHRTQLTSQRPLHGRTRGCKGVDYTSTYDVAFLVHFTFTSTKLAAKRQEPSF